MIEDEYEFILEQRRRQVMNDDGTPNVEAIAYVIQQAMKDGTAQVQTTGTDSNGNPLSQDKINEIIKNTVQSTEGATINVNGQPINIPLPSPAQLQSQSRNQSNNPLPIQNTPLPSIPTSSPPVRTPRKRTTRRESEIIKTPTTPKVRRSRSNKAKSSEIIEEEVVNKPKRRGRPRKTKE